MIMGATIEQAVLRMPPELWTGDKIDVMQRHARYIAAADELLRLRTTITEMEKKYKNRGRLMDAYVTALAEIADGRENPMEYARSVLRQKSMTLIESMTTLGSD